MSFNICTPPPSSSPSLPNINKPSRLFAKPTRLEANEDGVLYVNSACINCSACSFFAPDIFERADADAYHIVKQQPIKIDSKEFLQARAALAACPVSAIRATSQAEISHANKIMIKRNKNNSEISNDSMDMEVEMELLKDLTPQEMEISKALAINPKVNDLPLPFPLQVSHNIPVWMIGHHSEKTFGASPYLVKGRHKGKEISVLVDVPKFSQSAIRAIQSLLVEEGESLEGGEGNNGHRPGPDYMFLTHVDDTAQHDQWRDYFPTMKRIFHAGDLGDQNWVGDDTLEDVEILLDGKSDVEKETLLAFSLDGDIQGTITCECDTVQVEEVNKELQAIGDSLESEFLILHTPGHSVGSISLLRLVEETKPSKSLDLDRPSSPSSSLGKSYRSSSAIFTGDTLGYTTRKGGYLTGFPAYGYDLSQQSKTLQCLKSLASHYDHIFCGHGHPVMYEGTSDEEADGGEMSRLEKKRKDVEDAISELSSFL